MGPPLVHGSSHGKGRPKLPRAGFLPGGMQVTMGGMQVAAGRTQAAVGRTQVAMGGTWTGPKVIQPTF